MTQRKVLRVTNTGDQVSLNLHEDTLPSPASYEVLIRIRAASLNYRDLVLVEGNYPASTKPDVVPLSDGAGEVVAVGKDVGRFKVGDRVAASCTVHWIGGPHLAEYQNHSVGFRVDGMLAEYGLFHENALVHLPAYLSYIEAASLPCAAVTAWTSLYKATPIQPGQTILIQGTGGVSLFALQFAKIAGARVFAITSSDEKAEVLRKLGAESVVNYSTHPDWDQEILALTDGKGVDKVFDIAGEKTIVKSAASTANGGVILLIGYASGFGGGLSPFEVLRRSLTVMGSNVGSRTNFEDMLRAMATHQVRPIIDRVYPFAEYNEAYERLKSGKQVGKVVIDLS
ncbi:putative alcohol dehydrogenase [Daldinia vernicosa]|uniref:putative alcohol dehydrogenase n=1 Tax=Daldinia vernicosa TaxID=114800 RepID=UPI002008230E|nr:putative alcohol dehydrogenase [Daldinia vernicosa]KAI0848406.1 putative alcohol dehydrogenase [Daldinia vernicosa]